MVPIAGCPKWLCFFVLSTENSARLVGRRFRSYFAAWLLSGRPWGTLLLRLLVKPAARLTPKRPQEEQERREDRLSRSSALACSAKPLASYPRSLRNTLRHGFYRLQFHNESVTFPFPSTSSATSLGAALFKRGKKRGRAGRATTGKPEILFRFFFL